MQKRSFLSGCLFVLLICCIVPVQGQPLPVAEFLDPDGHSINFRVVEEKDGYVYAGRRDGKLFVFDTRDTLFSLDGTPGEFDELLTFDSPIKTLTLIYNDTLSALVRYKHVMYALGIGGIEVLDLTDPSSPTLMDENRVATRADRSSAIFDNYLIVCGRTTLQIYSLTDPMNPTKVAEYETEERFMGAVTGHSDLIYSVQGDLSGSDKLFIQIFDFSDRKSLNELRLVTTENEDRAFHLRVVGDTLVESSSSKIRIRDLGLSGLNLSLLDELANDGRVCSTAGNYVLGNGFAFRVHKKKLEQIASYPPGQTQTDGVPHGSVIRHDIGFLAQSGRILAVRYVSPPVLVFPQLAWGGQVVTEIFLSNPGLDTVTGKILFKSNQGDPVPVSIDGEMRYSMSFILQSGSIFKTKTDKVGELQVGYAEVIADPYVSDLSGTIGYNLEGNEVSVPSAVLSEKYHVVVERNQQANSGIAIANPGLVASTINGILLNNEGSVFALEPINLEPGEKIALFINEIFPAIPESFLGSFHVHSDTQVALSGFRQLTTGSLLSLSGSTTSIEPPN